MSLPRVGNRLKKGNSENQEPVSGLPWKEEMERGDDCEYQGGGEGKRKKWINSKTAQEVISKRFRERFHKAWWKRHGTSRSTRCCLLKWTVLVVDGSLECHDYCRMAAVELRTHALWGYLAHQSLTDGGTSFPPSLPPYFPFCFLSYLHFVCFSKPTALVAHFYFSLFIF